MRWSSTPCPLVRGTWTSCPSDSDGARASAYARRFQQQTDRANGVSVARGTMSLMAQSSRKVNFHAAELCGLHLDKVVLIVTDDLGLGWSHGSDEHHLP